MLGFKFELETFPKNKKLNIFQFQFYSRFEFESGNLSKAEDVENILIAVLIEDSCSNLENFEAVFRQMFY